MLILHLLHSSSAKFETFSLFSVYNGQEEHRLLNKNKVTIPIPVHDLENAAVFYSEILGLEQTGRNAVGVQFNCAGSTIGLHQSTTAGSSQATNLWWTVDDVEATVEWLKSRGVKFEKNYDLPHTKRVGDVYHLSDANKAAWFKDIDGNILGFGNF
jgi:extradiol dioxygenase family protein